MVGQFFLDKTLGSILPWNDQILELPLQKIPLKLQARNKMSLFTEICSRDERLRADFLNAVYFRQGLTCTLGLTNDLIDGGQPRAKNGI